ncbi:hypothetical protein N7520_000343 [Penicillium odoratum]|uniref:uncharacterized protein n=1 Tax=Penicillium odoratum TaxID=1167516 RepID=UPI002548FFB7|nr:uncharacterized protein N7520_000343 [Penicillium odoratum]KAJ5777097.1 hypothetical protein N7520_000343 [Penicillium odoratum]
MSTVSDLVAASAALRSPNNLSNEDYDRQLRGHVTHVRRLISKRDLGSIARDDALLDQFDPSNDSITYLFLLHLQIQTLREESSGTLPAELLPLGSFWSKAAHYLRTFDCIQVRYAGHEWLQLVEFMGLASQGSSKPILTAQLIRDALLRLDPSCAVLTSTHVLLTQLCLASRAYTCALPVLDKQIRHIPALPNRAPSNSISALCAEHESSLSFINETTGLSSKLSYRDYLRYFLYGGMIYLALKEWRKASHFLGTVISMPTLGSVSMIMVEAYKKWILVGLLEKGKLCSPPSITASHVVKTLQSLVKPYISLAHTFERGDVKKLEVEVDAARDIWCQDNNMGLVCQVASAYSRHSLINTSKVFAALTVSEVSSHISLLSTDTDEVGEANIASLVVAGTIDATLVHLHPHSRDTMLRFPDVSSWEEVSYETKIQSQFQEEGQILKSLFVGMEENSKRLGLSDEFIDHVIRGQLWPTAGSMNPSLGGNAGSEMEEDIMGDLS